MWKLTLGYGISTLSPNNPILNFFFKINLLSFCLFKELPGLISDLITVQFILSL